MRHEIVGVDMDATRWRRERQVKRLIRRQPIDLILDARLVTQIDGVDPVGHPDVERTRWLAELAARDGVSYLYLSSARVFSGSLTRAYRETDQPDAHDAVGKTLVEVETLLKEALEDVFILRLGLMFGGRRPNPLARALDALARGDRVKVSEQVRGVGVAADPRVRLFIENESTTGVGLINVLVVDEAVRKEEALRSLLRVIGRREVPTEAVW